MAELTDADRVRVLINDYRPDHPADQVFDDAEIAVFLDLEGTVKLAAAQAIDVIADNEALVLKVIRTQGGVSTDGAKVADALRKRAASLRQQAEDEEYATTGGDFSMVSPSVGCVPELTEWPNLTCYPSPPV